MNIKKNFVLLLTAIVICASVFVFAACAETETETMRVNATVLVGDEVFNVENFECKTDSTVETLIDYLVAEKGLHIKYTDSAHGKFITEIGSLIPQGYAWICFYTSVESDKDITEYANEFTFQETTLYNAGVGVSSAKLIDNAVYAFKIIE